MPHVTTLIDLETLTPERTDVVRDSDSVARIESVTMWFGSLGRAIVRTTARDASGAISETTWEVLP